MATDHVRTVYEGLKGEGESEVVMLTRSAWAGMSRYGAALWSGDTASHWNSLQASVGAGLNVQLSGIAWRTTDIGGDKKGDVNSTDFRQLVYRWFQFGLTCPLFRQHGEHGRLPTTLLSLGCAFTPGRCGVQASGRRSRGCSGRTPSAPSSRSSPFATGSRLTSSKH